MNQTAWETTHSVVANVSPACAWSYMTNVANWDDPPAIFELDGPFAAGSQGATRMPDQEPRRWRLIEVRPMTSYTIETALEGAAMTFEWTFTGLTEETTRLTQRISLTGENAAAYADQVRMAFGPNLAPGMRRIADAMERAKTGLG